MHSWKLKLSNQIKAMDFLSVSSPHSNLQCFYRVPFTIKTPQNKVKWCHPFIRLPRGGGCTKHAAEITRSREKRGSTCPDNSLKNVGNKNVSDSHTLVTRSWRFPLWLRAHLSWSASKNVLPVKELLQTLAYVLIHSRRFKVSAIYLQSLRL